jgi:enoyl-CoA hydratase/carnithine racemase
MKRTLNTLAFNITDGIGHLEMCQLPANLMTTEFFSEFNEMVEELRIMNGLHAIVISSTGRHFSSGADLEELLEQVVKPDKGIHPEMNENWRALSEKNYHSFLFFEETEIPVIAAIRGVCIGSALELALFSHFRFCGEDAVFGLPETTFNLMPALGGIRKFAALFGQAKAIELVLRGNTFGAEEARQYQLVDRIIPRRKVVEYSISFARKVMKNYKKQKAPLYLQQIPLDDSFFI